MNGWGLANSLVGLIIFIIVIVVLLKLLGILL